MNSVITTKDISEIYQEEHDVAFTKEKRIGNRSLSGLSLGAILILLSLYSIKDEPFGGHLVVPGETLITKTVAITDYSQIENELKTPNYSWITAKGLSQDDEIYTDYRDIL